MSIGLNFDAEKWGRDRALKERELLSKALSGDDIAATELLFWYSKFGSMNAPDVQEAIEHGARDVMEAVLAATSLPNSRHGAEVQPLMYFGGKERKRGPKSTRPLLEMRHAFGVTLTMEDLRKALTTEWAKNTKSLTKPKLPKDEWPQTLAEVEGELVGYVLHSFKNATEEEARRYIYESFPGIDWGSSEEPVEYPQHW